MYVRLFSITNFWVQKHETDTADKHSAKSVRRASMTSRAEIDSLNVGLLTHESVLEVKQKPATDLMNLQKI